MPYVYIRALHKVLGDHMFIPFIIGYALGLITTPVAIVLITSFAHICTYLLKLED